MFTRAFTLGVASLALLLAVPAAPASAVTQDDLDQGQVAYVRNTGTVEANDYRAFTSYTMMSAGERAAAAASTGCKEISGKVTGYNAFNYVLWTFRQTADWCWGGGKITYKYSDYNVTSPFPGWDFKGLVDSQSSAGTTPPWIRFRQGKFQQCMPMPWGDVCAASAYPWVRAKMWANGTYTQSYGY